MHWTSYLLFWHLIATLDPLLQKQHQTCLAASRQQYLNETDLQTTSRRKKRSLTFPKGSAFVLTMSIVKAIQLKVPPNWNLDLEFDMIWPIPKGLDAVVRRPGWSPHRRHRRQLYSNLELALDSQGLPGKQCILRTICEIKFALNPPGISLVEDLIRVVFSYPAEATTIKHDDYDTARMTENDCAAVYFCPVSFLSLLLDYDENLDSLKI